VTGRGWIASLALLAACAADPASVPSQAAVPSPPALEVAVPMRPAPGAGPELVDRPGFGGPPSQPPIEARYVPALAGDYCVDRDVVASAQVDPTLAALDRTHALPAGYVPADLVPASSAGLDGTSGERLVRAALVDDLAAMRAAWQAAGLTITVDSAYRSHASQAATFDGWVARVGLEAARLRTARPGHSEHQLGTALDFGSPGWSGRFGDWAVETAEGAWLAAHAWEYGFVMSYPAGAEDTTCFGYEPWHYRWIGRPAAAAQHASGDPLRVFLGHGADG
jgi:D-alanyl-D-alanine carboxypeptidase